MNHFSHSDIIPSFRDEDEWDDVDHFPYRESVNKKSVNFPESPNRGAVVGWVRYLGLSPKKVFSF